MKSNLAYIDDAVERKISQRHEGAAVVTPADSESAKRAAIKIVAGFEVSDEASERRALDNIIAERRKVIEAFRKDREASRALFSNLGITPLAFVPIIAWNTICDTAGLFRLSPDRNGRVGIAENAFNGYMVETKVQKRGMFNNPFEARSYSYRDVEGDRLNEYARENWPAFLKTMFGGQVSPVVMNHSLHRTGSATLVLPIPPANVQETLLKTAAGEYLGLQVAAVAEAISFKETPSQILRNEVARKEENARRREQIDADPIIYHEQGSCVAVIAQFGDFPIEVDVVDAVVASNDFLKEKPVSIQYLRGDSLEDIYRNALSQQNAMVSAMGQRALAGNGLFGL